MKKLSLIFLTILMVFSLFSCAPEVTPDGGSDGKCTISFDIKDKDGKAITMNPVKVDNGAVYTVPKDLIAVPDGSVFVITWNGRHIYPGNKITVTGDITIKGEVVEPALKYEDKYHGENEVFVKKYPVDSIYAGDIVIPEKTSEGKLVTGIEAGAFYECINLKSVFIPETVKTINSSAFSGCSKLTYVNLPNEVSVINSYTFKGCTSLESVIIPDGVTEIGESAFYNCTKISSITIPCSVTKIGRHAFEACKNLKSITIPSSVTSMGESVFNNCPKLTEIIVEKPASECTGEGWPEGWNGGVEVTYSNKPATT